MGFESTDVGVVSFLSGLKTECPFYFNKAKKLGHVRCQFGYEKQIANQFMGQEDLSEKIQKYNILLGPVNKTCNLIQFEWIRNYEYLTHLCKGEEEVNYFYQDEQCDYWIRLNSFGVNEYNCYIHIYHK